MRKDSRLVFLGTTSLYAHGVSQYNRLRLPPGIIAPDQDEIRFKMLGYTSGFGTVQFPEATMRAIEHVIETDRGYRDVNSIFGEGRSPKLRKLRSGLQLLGFDPSAVLHHHQPRCIYGMRLNAQTEDFSWENGCAARLHRSSGGISWCDHAHRRILAGTLAGSAASIIAPALAALGKRSHGG